jgi:NADH dehydrogenase [ubiquinone] 1 alpha subcomplex assembly factor 5
VVQELFDRKLRALRRDRAFRQGPELFLHERAFEDVLERLALVRRRFGSALLVGCPDPGWREPLLRHVETVRIVDPGPLFAVAAHGDRMDEDRLEVEPGSYDLCIAIGTLDSVSDLPRALLTIRFALREDSLLLGAMVGGDSLPRLRAAMRAADERMGAASPHVHPRIEPAALTSLLSDAGFIMPVVDVDRVQVRYESFRNLVRDLRAMGATNVLTARSQRPLTRTAAAAAAGHFSSHAEAGRTVERFDLLHFAAWTPAAGNG